MEDVVYYETKHWKVILGENQSYLAYSIIILKRDCGEVSLILDEEWEEFKQLTRILEKGIKNTFGARMFNWTCLMNDAYKNNNPKPQIHWHLRPRYNKNVEFAKLRFEDPEFSHHYNKFRKNFVSVDILKLIGEEINKNLENGI